MADIYKLLSKYFQGKASEEEAHKVTQFKRANKTEFVFLKQLWEKESIKVKDYDRINAWDKVAKQLTPIEPQVIPLYPKLLKIASIAALFLIGIFAAYLLRPTPTNIEMVAVETALKAPLKKIELADGSIVYLNKKSRLSYPIKFEKDKREVILSGEAFFEVAKDVERPFLISTNHTTVRVLGTSFHIDTNKKETEISVKTGKVEVQFLFDKQSVLLTPNQTALATNTALKAFPTKDVNYLAWQNGNFNFKDTPLEKVISDLNTYYNDEITLSKNNAACKLTASFEDIPLSDIMEVVTFTCNMKLKKNNNSYELY